MTRIITAAIAATAIYGCSNPAENKPSAVVESAVEQPPAETVAAEARTLTFSSEGSKLDWVGSKVTGSHDGGFEAFSGKVEVSGDEVSGIDVEIDLSSVWSDSDRLTGHLKSVDFFDVENNPEARFVSTKVEQEAADGYTHRVTGNLTFHGVTKSVSFPALIEVGQSGLKARSEFSLDRKVFGVNYPGMPDDLIKDEVLVKLDIKAGE
jgi:polyisoprenoid-binding protein YceI